MVDQQATHHRSTRRTQTAWTNLIDEWKHSRRTQQAFCEESNRSSKPKRLSKILTMAGGEIFRLLMP